MKKIIKTLLFIKIFSKKLFKLSIYFLSSIKQINLSKQIKMILIFSFCLIFIFFFSKIENFMPQKIVESIQDTIASMGNGSGFPIKVTGSRINCKNFKILNKDILVLSDTSLVCYNKTAKKILNKPHGFESPVLKCAGNKALIYNLHGSDYKIETKCANILTNNLTENIISGDICESGKYAFATEGKECLSKLVIFSEKMNEIFTYYFSDCYVNNIALSNNGNLAAVSGVCSEKGKFKSLIYVFEMTLEKEKFKFECDDTIFLDISFLSDKKLVAVGDKKTLFINTSLGEQKDFDYEDKPLTSFDINSKAGVILSLANKSDFTECNILKLNNKGEIITSIQSQMNVFALSHNDEVIALLGDGKFNVYSKLGKIICSSSIDRDIKRVQLLSSRSAYILGTCNIGLLDFN
ncbi:MAG: DUF5711 family protein [Oscillospiraceae bacterium]|jgi:hypothetical protein|nr:DUF5711 family protein [Oscillospiraceae bacterium]